MNRKHSVANRQLKADHQLAPSVPKNPAQRVVQPNMLYVIGLPPALAHEELLRREEYCGQYGRITRVLIKDSSSNSYGSYSAYITYSTEEEASLAMLALNNFFYDRYRMYASYGTNKYCSQYVRQGRCQKRDCLFLHRLDPDRQVTEQDNKKHFQDQQILAARLLGNKHQEIPFKETPGSVFPDCLYVRQLLIEEGFIGKPPKEESKESVKFNCEEVVSAGDMKEVQRPCYRLKEGKMRSQNSTECSPKHESSMPKLPVPEEDHDKVIMKRILFRVTRNKGSVLGFNKNSTEEHDMGQRESISTRIRELMRI